MLGEYADCPAPDPKGDPLPENGDPEALLLPLRGVADLEYLGGVLYCEPGVGGSEVGPRPNSWRCCGVRAISDRSSVVMNSGRSGMREYARSSIGKSVLKKSRNGYGKWLCTILKTSTLNLVVSACLELQHYKVHTHSHRTELFSC